MPLIPTKIRHNGRKFDLAARTPDFCYYVDFKESDETAAVLMYTLDGKLISNNYFAFEDLTRVIEEKKCTWLSKKMQATILPAKAQPATIAGIEAMPAAALVEFLQQNDVPHLFKMYREHLTFHNLENDSDEITVKQLIDFVETEIFFSEPF